jgi:hypothetical protein
MAKRHSSYLLRCWELRDGLQRVEVEHIQSGDKALFKSVEEIVQWSDLHNAATASPDISPLPGGREDEESM